MIRTFGELREILAREQRGWLPPHHIADETELAQPAIGAEPTGLIPANTAIRIDFRAVGPGRMRFSRSSDFVADGRPRLC